MPRKRIAGADDPQIVVVVNGDVARTLEFEFAQKLAARRVVNQDLVVVRVAHYEEPGIDGHSVHANIGSVCARHVDDVRVGSGKGQRRSIASKLPHFGGGTPVCGEYDIVVGCRVKEAGDGVSSVLVLVQLKLALVLSVFPDGGRTAVLVPCARGVTSAAGTDPQIIDKGLDPNGIPAEGVEQPIGRYAGLACRNDSAD